MFGEDGLTIVNVGEYAGTLRENEERLMIAYPGSENRVVFKLKRKATGNGRYVTFVTARDGYHAKFEFIGTVFADGFKPTWRLPSDMQYLVRIYVALLRGGRDVIRTRECCACGQILKEPASIRQGIGPVCVQHYAFKMPPQWKGDDS